MQIAMKLLSMLYGGDLCVVTPLCHCVLILSIFIFFPARVKILKVDISV